MSVNDSSRYLYAYETVPGTAEIVDLDTVTYIFGHYANEMKEWKSISTENPLSPHYSYGSREAKQTQLEKVFKPISHNYDPVDPKFLCRFLKDPTDADPVTMEALDEGKTYPITLRHEMRGGTNPTHRQAVGCYTVGVALDGMYNKALRVEEVVAWQELQDVGDEPVLTTDPLASGGCAVDGIYVGTPKFNWNATPRPEVIRFRFSGSQKWEGVYDPANDKQEVNLYEYEPYNIIIDAILSDDADCWDEFHDREIRTCYVEFFKADTATYIKLQFTLCQMLSFVETGARHEGYYSAQIVIGCGGAMTVAANKCGTGDGIIFDDHYKGVVT